MAANFVVEDGTGVVGANSYVDVAYADQYFLDRARATWTGADSVKQSALVRATDYVTTRFTFKCDTVTDLGVAGPVPEKLKRAVSEYAVRALSAELAPDPTTDDTGQIVLQKTETVGPLTESTTYAPGGTVYVFKPYPEADILLRGLLKTSGNRVIRN